MTVHLAGPPRRRGLPAPARRLLRLRARRALRAVGHEGSEVSVTLVDDREMAELNARYRGAQGPTDVLAFSLLEGRYTAFRGGLLGEIVIGVETAARQARARGRVLDDEVAGLLIHGLLHLLGYDHELSEDARRMRAEERRVWGMVDP